MEKKFKYMILKKSKSLHLGFVLDIVFILSYILKTWCKK